MVILITLVDHNFNRFKELRWLLIFALNCGDEK
jgi:hypothetical protein